MDDKIYNESTMSYDFLVEYFLFHKVKKLSIICFLMSILGTINLIILIITTITGPNKAIWGIVLDLVATLLLTALAIGSPIIITNIEYKKLAKFGEDALNFKYIFNEDNYEIINCGNTFEEKYEDIKDVFYYENFIVIKAKGKKNYILDNKGFNCDVKEFFDFLGKDE